MLQPGRFNLFTGFTPSSVEERGKLGQERARGGTVGVVTDKDT